ncbi:unnamed protein product [Onchocerca ochengi]|uniref:RECA_2 domain-containing protein n=2 Tax=Onchocerca TaxID=6281 RepID=A0A182EM30_ONCOC|nr:unnamed protein product [Onchocerca ochengi]
MGTAEEVLDELLDLVEASSKNPIEEFLNDFVEIPSKGTVEEILDDLTDTGFKDEMEEVLENMAETSSKTRLKEDLTVSIEDTINRLLASLVKTSSKEIMDQLLKDLVQVTINDPIEEIVKKMSSLKDSTEKSFENQMEEFPENLMEANSSSEEITELSTNLESFADSTQEPDDPLPDDSNFFEEAYSMCAAVDKSIIYRRNDPGTTREEWCNWPDMPFEEMDNTLNVQQYIQQCIHKDPSDVDTILKAPPGQEEGVWKYEHVRQFCMQLNGLTLLLQDECKPDVCVQMTATEQWIFLCAAHKNPKECSAIDYTRHTLDGAAALLNSNKYFPSRVSIKESSIAKIGSVCRRIYRIFSHAYFHHPELFEKFETETFLCRRFTVFVKKYNLMANEHLIVPILEQKPNYSNFWVIMDIDDPEYEEETGLNLFLRLGAPWLLHKTGCSDIDIYLNGGIAKGKLTEFVGNVASGKTQLCLSLIANQLIDDEKEQSKIVYIDTNGSFRSSRLLQMLKSRGVQDENKAERMLKRVFIARTYDEKDLRTVLSNIQVIKYLILFKIFN